MNARQEKGAAIGRQRTNGSFSRHECTPLSLGVRAPRRLGSQLVRFGTESRVREAMHESVRTLETGLQAKEIASPRRAR